MHVAVAPRRPRLAALRAGAEYIVHVFIYALLIAHHFVVRQLLPRLQQLPIAPASTSTKPAPGSSSTSPTPSSAPYAPPSHVALSGALLPPPPLPAPSTAAEAASLSREEQAKDHEAAALATLAAHIVAVAAAGVRHITLHDAFRDLPVEALLSHLSTSAALTAASFADSGVVVTDITAHATYSAVLDTPPTRQARAQPPLAQPPPQLDEMWRRRARLVDVPLDDPPPTALRITVVRARAGRHTLARAARKLARDRLARSATAAENSDSVLDEEAKISSNSDSEANVACANKRQRGAKKERAAPSASELNPKPGAVADAEAEADADAKVEAVTQWLDANTAACMLPSEPDVLVCVTAPGHPSVPVLRDFPPWQLRLTQLVFTDESLASLSVDQLLRLTAKAASAPRRFGR